MDYYKNNNNSFYEADSVLKNAGIWADYKNVSKEELENNRMVWKNNKLISLKEAKIEFDEFGKPITPVFTGKSGRGLLGRFGPNHACDPIITRFNFYNCKIEFIAVKRNDTNQWAIPGGMVDPGEKVSQTLKREFIEEASNNTDKKIIDKIFDKSNETILYSGPTYGDPRTTDCAWIETFVANYHIDYNLWSKINLTNQPEENSDVSWISCNNKDLYGDHYYFVQLAKKNVKKQLYKSFLKNVLCLYLGTIIVIFIYVLFEMFHEFNFQIHQHL